MVRAIVAEVYGHLLPAAGIGTSGNWDYAHVALQGESIVGVTLVFADWVDDLWVAADARRQGIGTRLLAVAERDVARNGFTRARLRLVAENRRALAFYGRHGWLPQATYPHERHGFPMTEMSKRVS